MYPTGVVNSSGVWIGIDAVQWGQPVLFTIEVVASGCDGTAAAPPLPGDGPSTSVAAAVPVDDGGGEGGTPVTDAEPPTANSANPVIVGVTAGCGVLVVTLVVVGAVRAAQRRRAQRNASAPPVHVANPVSGAAAGRSTAPPTRDPEHVTTPRRGAVDWAGGHHAGAGAPIGAGVGPLRGAGGGARATGGGLVAPRRPPTPAPLDYLPSSPAFRE